MLHAPSPGAAFSRRDFGLGKNNHSCEQNGHWSKYRGQVPAVRGCYSGGGDHGGASAAVSKMRPRPRFLEPQPRDTPVFGAAGTTQSRQPCRIEHEHGKPLLPWGRPWVSDLGSRVPTPSTSLSKPPRWGESLPWAEPSGVHSQTRPREDGCLTDRQAARGLEEGREAVGADCGVPTSRKKFPFRPGLGFGVR